MLRRLSVILILLCVAVAGTLWAVAAPESLPPAAFEGLPEPDVENGEAVFLAGGCASCHAAPAAAGETAADEPDAEVNEAPVLAGGRPIASDFGTFHVPNISPGPEGIGDWTFEMFAEAMVSGVAPDGTHYYPAFPYGSYVRMSITDINDLWGYIRTLPESDNVAPPHEIPFPFNVNRAVGLWKYLYLDRESRIEVDVADPVLMRGQYLVEAVGHCGECHTPRNWLGGFVEDRWLAGAPNPDGDGRIPNITPGGSIEEWSAEDIAYYLESGFTPDFDVVGGSMSAVQQNFAELPASDREAVAAYLKSLPAR
jgi:mono/diheme cytochrome c family protein